jgi:hypothetical protein
MTKKNSASIRTVYWPLAGILGLVVTLFGWGLSTPVGGTPDEDFHLVSIWCAAGGEVGMCEPGSSEQERLVDSGLVDAPCFAQKPDVSAACQAENAVFESDLLVETDRGNFKGAYPQLFYTAMHAFAGENVQSSVIIMRFFNALLFASALISLWLLMPPPLRSSLFFATALTIVPLGLFLIPSINPSSWAILGVMTTFFATAGALGNSGWKRYVLWGLSGLGLLLAAGSRYDALLYALIAIICAFILAKTVTITRKFLLISLGVAGAAALLFIVLGGLDLVARIIGQAGSSTNNENLGVLGVLFNNITQLPLLFAGFSGAMGLGWLDTFMPLLSWMTAATLIWAALFTRLAQLHKKALWVTASVALLLALVPLVTLQRGMSLVGESVQSRYIFPLFLVLVATAFFQKTLTKHFFSLSQLVVITIGLFLSQALALLANMKRYISGGFETSGLNLNEAAVTGWWWSTAPSPLSVLVLSVIGFGVFLSVSFIFTDARTNAQEKQSAYEGQKE